MELELQELRYPRRAGIVTPTAWTGGLYVLTFATMMVTYCALRLVGTWP